MAKARLVENLLANNRDTFLVKAMASHGELLEFKFERGRRTEENLRDDGLRVFRSA
jgi:hypothetical protein